MDYKQKYIKYKIKYLKYLKLKNLFGGNYLIPLKNCSPPIGKENISEKEKNKIYTGIIQDNLISIDLKNKYSFENITDEKLFRCTKILKKIIIDILGEYTDKNINIYRIIDGAEFESKQSNLNDKSLTIYYDNLYVLWNLNLKLLEKIYLSYVIVDPANTTSMKYFVKKIGKTAYYASGSIYEKYKITSGNLDINYMIDENGTNFIDESEDERIKYIENYKAIGIKYYNKVWIIHVSGPYFNLNNWEYKPPYNFVNTYISVFKVFLNIKKLEPWLNLRFSLISLGSYLDNVFDPSKYDISNIEFKKNCLNDVVNHTLKSFSKEDLDILNNSNICFALGSDYNNLKP